ncbi:MAG: DUF4281 domain-containing protein [Alphaproteobacteria bacterium]|nr:MAG: DUF4281 domain-containing protein [Alphaproteobacteria bacterium]
MSWQAIFGAMNVWAMICWAALILLPRKPAVLSALLYLGVMMMCFVYAAALLSVVGGFVDPVGGEAQTSFSSIEGVRAIFASDGGVTIGWTHYLAFDLFVGIWIARDADAKDFSRFVQAPILFATFMAGPVGLFLWLLVREGKARALGRWS